MIDKGVSRTALATQGLSNVFVSARCNQGILLTKRKNPDINRCLTWVPPHAGVINTAAACGQTSPGVRCWLEPNQEAIKQNHKYSRTFPAVY